MKRRFFICSVGEIGQDYAKDNLHRCVEYNGHFMHRDTKHKGVFDDVKKDDIIFLKYNDRLIAYGKVKYTDTIDKEELGGWNYAIYVDKLFFLDDSNIEKGVCNYGVKDASIGTDQYATIKEIKTSFALKKLEEINKTNQLFVEIKMESKIQVLMDLLKSTRNLILTGAPGTGKTYLARQIADVMDAEVGFVQFHPSYDYTDFVEGLRPVQDENGNVGFERKDGVFKTFCAKALKTSTQKEDDIFDEAWDALLEQIREGIANEKLIKIGSWEYGLSKFDSLKYSSLNSPSKYSFTITKQNVYDVYQGKKARPSGGYQKDMQDIVDYMQQKFNLAKYVPSQEQKKDFVFIIDEINRGEISKIFGELFFSIDPGYRGKKGKVRTQYANMVESPNEFDIELGITDSKNYGHFFVPENVYIIGTMNDIDRSVESMDFAFRRRFAFKEIKANENTEMLEQLGSLKDEAIQRMTNLNAAIEKVDGLSSAYHIGASYFLKVKDYGNDFGKLWEYHLEGLLREYLRGMQGVEETIIELKKAYDNGVADSNNGQ
ncbi:MAG: AAA family ATPase [Bacteroidales bacterium]|nr:AAA family ATPase [Bacteroidales bacterium]